MPTPTAEKGAASTLAAALRAAQTPTAVKRQHIAYTNCSKRSSVYSSSSVKGSTNSSKIGGITPTPTA